MLGFTCGLLLAAGGCMEADPRVTVRTDGSGELRVRLLVRDDARERAAQLAWLVNRLNLSDDLPLVALLRMIHEAGGDPMQAMYRREVLEAWGRELGPDVRLERTRRLSRAPDMNGFEALYTFPDIRQVAWAGEGAPGAAPDRIGFDFLPGQQPVLRMEARPGRAWLENARDERAQDLMARLGLRAGLGRAAKTVLEGLHLRLSVGTDSGTLWAPQARRRLGPERVVVAEIRADEMDGEDLLRLLRMRDLADLEQTSRRPTPGLSLQDPRRAFLMRIVPRSAPGGTGDR